MEQQNLAGETNQPTQSHKQLAKLLLLLLLQILEEHIILESNILSYADPFGFCAIYSKGFQCVG